MSTNAERAPLDGATAIDLYRRMRRIRLVEEAIAARYPEGRMRCPTHLSVGQEAAAAVVGLLLATDDVCVSTHRAHAHYLAKGGNLDRLIAELYGRESGCSAGKGGSMHLVDRSVGFMGSTAIVASTIPVGTGLALALQLRDTRAIACVFFGDAAIEEGVWFEALNFAAVRRLPVLYVCENNRYSVYSPLAVRQPEGREIHALAAAVGVDARHCDGGDVGALHRAAAAAVAAVRGERRPVLIEIATYRWREHCGPNYDDALGYRDAGEVAYWRAHDALEAYERTLIGDGVLDAAAIAVMQAAITAEIDRAFRFAEASRYPEEPALYEHVYGRADDGTIPWRDL